MNSLRLIVSTRRMLHVFLRSSRVWNYQIFTSVKTKNKKDTRTR